AVHVRRRTRTRCVGKLVSGRVKFTVSGHALRATLTRGGRAVATGTVTVGRRGDVALLGVGRRLASGRYSLILSRGQRHVATLRVRIG
ncbi:MAG TPA: hypothetical protein VFN55_02975, partial [Solirubrobacteraceae bacterium]|nr:hypothetical protein [Solirubrobacteraceae bacterium]